MKKFFNMKNLGISLFGGLFLGGCCQLGIIHTVVLMLSLFLLIPGILKAIDQEKESYRRFQDAGMYLSQMESSFKNNRTIFDCLRETRDLFRDGEMKDCLKKAVNALERGSAGSEAYRKAFGIIEENYGCVQMSLTHDFFLTNTENGGSRTLPVEVLEKRRIAWSKETEKCRSKKRHMLNAVLWGILIILMIAEIFVRVPEMISEEMRIVNLGSERTATLLLIICLVLIARHVYRKNAEDWLAESPEKSEEKINNAYKYLEEFDPGKEMVKSIKWAAIPLILTLIFTVTSKSVIPLSVGIPITVLFLNQYRLEYSLVKKNLRKEVERDYPKWLLTIILLLDRESVIGAIYKSMDTAPNVLKYPLACMQKTLNKKPNDPEAFFSFLEILEMPQVTESMKLLYSISAGTGGNPEKQLLQIVDKNTAMTLRSEEIKNENRVAGIMWYMFFPVLPVSIKMMFDMFLMSTAMFSSFDKMI